MPGKIAVFFEYYGKLIQVEAKLKEKLKDIIEKHVKKAGIDTNKVFFLYLNNLLDQKY